VKIRPIPRAARSPTCRRSYVVEDHADHVLATFKTQQEAIDWSRKNGHAPAGRARAAPERQKETGPLAGGVSVTFFAEPGSKEVRLWWQMEGSISVSRFGG
jgi:hypothetical protein